MRTNRLFIAVGISVAFGAAATGLAACSSSTSPSSTGSSGSGSCTNALPIAFNPMYSAFIAGGTHTFLVPAVVRIPVGVTAADVKWSASDSSAVGFQPNSDLTTDGFVGTTIQVLTAPSSPVTITATVPGNLCGSAPLNVTAATEMDWQIGNARYNDGMSLHLPMFGGGGDGGGGAPPMIQLDGGSIFEMGGAQPACTNCHGPTATDNMFTDVSHTPEQTAGFSDDDLLSIILHGTVPDGGYFDPNIVMPSIWHMIHQWQDITTDQQKGIIVYLRSLPPAAQKGAVNFGGFFRDGGAGGAATD